MERYPTSIYVPAVRMNLGRLYMNGAGMAQPDADRAAAQFLAVVKSKAAGVVDDALLEFAKSSIESGRFGEAKEAIAKLLAEFPDSEKAAEAARVREGLARGWRTLREIYGN